MAKHEFGIMMDAPQQGTRYDEYEPWKYTCISVDDAYITFTNFDLLASLYHTFDAFYSLRIAAATQIVCGVQSG